ncbi:MAG TPA: hypothetical protein VES93_11980 [Ornithinibacter sp.]|nr:hypothetical protein [Ornithinibacter sp.]
MPGPLTPSRRRARRGWGVGAALLSIGVAATLGGCTTGRDAGATPSAPAAATASAGSGSRADVAGTTAAVADLLRARAAALAAGDEEAYAATVADPSSASGRRQLDSFVAARALRVSRLEVAEPVLDRAGDTSPTSPVRAEVVLRYRVDDLDRGDRVARLGYDLVRSVAGWTVEAERPVGPGATAPWVAMPTLEVARGVHGVVAGTVPAARLAEHLAVVDRAVPPLREQWRDTPRRVLVLAPASVTEADALLGRPARSGAAPVAATTEGPTGAGGTATGDRVVLDPTAFARLTASGRDVVLTHELAHVAVRSSVPGRPATWLAEGYADHVGYDRADVPSRRLVAPLVAAIRSGQEPHGLPTTSDLQPASGEIEVPYLLAWQAVELIARDHGEAALRRLVAAAASTGSDADAEAATDAALVSELGTTRAELTGRWLTRLGDLGTNPG